MFLTKAKLLNVIQAFFRANVFQVKLDKISFLFKFKLASHKLSDNQIPSALFTKLKKKRKVNT